MKKIRFVLIRTEKINAKKDKLTTESRREQCERRRIKVDWKIKKNNVKNRSCSGLAW